MNKYLKDNCICTYIDNCRLPALRIEADDGYHLCVINTNDDGTKETQNVDGYIQLCNGMIDDIFSTIYAIEDNIN